MPKKKTLPPPDDFSPEISVTAPAEELPEQQVEAAGSDNTETPLAGPPEVDLGSGDVIGTADVEENELDAENTADAAETVPVSDEKAEDPEYDSILQELNSSTPAPLDSSGENALDALLLEGNAENAPPAEDETESADGETAPQPTAPPAPAGRRDSYILTVDAKDRIETEEERREVIWHEIKTSHIAGRILTGTLDGVEQTPSGRTIVVVDYKGYRIAIPLKEMMLYSGPVPYGARYKPFMERMNSILATMLTAEIDFIVRGLDNTARSVVASRKAAMLRKRQTFYLDTNEDGVPMIYEGRVVQARVIGVAEKVLRAEVFGVECTIFARDLSAAWFGDAREYYSVGDRVLVRVLTIDRDDINHISITADIRSVSSTANQSNLDKCVLQGKYAGRVTDVRHGVVFIRLNNGVNAVAHTCYDRRMPERKTTSALPLPVWMRNAASPSASSPESSNRICKKGEATMKILSKLALCLLLAMSLTVSAFAAQVPDSLVAENLNGQQRLVKTYTLSPEVDPDELKEEDFSYDGYLYTWAYTTKVEHPYLESKTVTETVTVNTAKNDLAQILAELSPSMPYEKDGFSGELVLDHTTLSTEASGYTTKYSKTTETKVIGNLDRNDMSYVPATTVKNGKTLALANVEWQVTGTALVGEALVPAQYQAVATYSASSSYQAATGYVTTAEYHGTVTSEGVDSITYTVVYTGSEIVPEKTHIWDNDSLAAPLLIIAAVLLCAGIAAAALILLRRRKNVYVYVPDSKPREYRLIAKFRVELDSEIPAIDAGALTLNPGDTVAVEVKKSLARHLAGREFTVSFPQSDHTYTIQASKHNDWHEFTVPAEEEQEAPV